LDLYTGDTALFKPGNEAQCSPALRPLQALDQHHLGRNSGARTLTQRGLDAVSDGPRATVDGAGRKARSTDLDGNSITFIEVLAP
jgi:hypothetical protein